jgi:uncharacterized protein (DUF362 family)
LARVALIKGDDRRENVRSALELIKEEVASGAAGKRIVIKPNFVSIRRQLAATHLDATRGILDFLRDIETESLIIAEGACGRTQEGYKNFGYTALVDEYGVELCDLNQDSYEYLYVLDSHLHPLPLRIAKTILDPDAYLISACVLKTHDSVLATLSLKNLLMGMILHGDKSSMHQGVKEINYNLFLLAQRVRPHLAVIDGFTGMQGNGPVSGEPIETRVAIASTDFLAADRVGLEVMGIRFEDVGYLQFCAQAGLGEGNLKNIELLGTPLKECRKKFVRHSSFKRQLAWK